MAGQVGAPRPRALSDAAQALWPYCDQIRRGWRPRGWGSQRGTDGSALRGSTSPTAAYRFAWVHCEFGAPSITVRVAEPPPSEATGTDFDLLGLWTDPETGPRWRLYRLLVTLCFSGCAFLAICLRQDLPAVLDGLEAAWTFLTGGVRRLVIDNLKAAVTRAGRYPPTIDKFFGEYAQYRGFVVDPAAPQHATRIDGASTYRIPSCADEP